MTLFAIDPEPGHRHRWDGPEKPVGRDMRPTCRHCGRPKLKESHFREQIVNMDARHPGLADQLGWEHVGWRPAKTTMGWRTPGTGTMASGWPDLVLVHPRVRRILFVELKGDDGKLDPEQERVLAVLRTLPPPCEVHVWWPDDVEAAGRVLLP